MIAQKNLKVKMLNSQKIRAFEDLRKLAKTSEEAKEYVLQELINKHKMAMTELNDFEKSGFGENDKEAGFKHNRLNQNKNWIYKQIEKIAKSAGAASAKAQQYVVN
jgi:hypothetical protein